MNQTDARKSAKKAALRHLVLVGALFAVGIILANLLIGPLMPADYLKYLQVIQMIATGYVVIEILGNLVYQLASLSSEETAKSMKSLVRIAGAIIMIALTISFLSQDPVIAASISTISGLVIGFAASSLIGNAIAGIYLSIARPFKIGQQIKVFSEIGIVEDIGLLYTRLVLGNGDHMLASNSSMVTTQVIIRSGTPKPV